ncbi:uncharacterized protein A1O9_12046 [Exophiala aquamarina CBS 119918]|uniref:Transcription factor domain-containing protein n=1 Tax=Exophiala aquamarina CBS 119918 TaxID=1182545 RepID=A0A072NWQ7_9EURO|nr:uncharacterized protein A1O9_12046 [Exophiala aquamarina CBS 119918]KEF52056.1 hypothetical protein A1O9_12046 [Exophiala aquamarina CBS 119918]
MTLRDDFTQADETVTQSDAESDMPDELGPNAPAYLRSLFDNNLISSEGRGVDTLKLTATTGPLIRKAREELQRLIPPKGDVVVIARFADAWLTTYHSLFPSRAVTQGSAELIDRHDEMMRHDVEPTTLAIWLISIAITVQQVSRDVEDQLSGIKNPTQYCKTVSEAVSHTILRHDSILGTIEGIETGLHFLRLHAGRGNFINMWLTLRRIIAISEVIGLPHAARSLERAKAAPYSTNVRPSLSKPEETRLLEKAETWAGICMIDRIAGMLFNLPAGTKRYQSAKLAVLDSNGQVVTKAYLSSLTEIAKQVYDLDDGSVTGLSDAELYAEALRIDQELISLASLPPQSWWNTYTPRARADQLLQYWHAYITIRVHLKLTLQSDASQNFDYSRYSCMNACSTAIRRYLDLRRGLPEGFFVGRIVDLQALTAGVVLVLAYHNSRSARHVQFQAQTIESPDLLIAQLVDLMDSISCLKAADFAKQAVITLRSLSALLDENSASKEQDLTLTVPLLGKIFVRKNRNPVAAPISQSDGTIPQLSQATNANQNVAPAFTPATSDLSGQTLPVANSWPWDPLSLFIEDNDREALFHQALMTEDFGQMDASVGFTAFDFTT